jgi:hypothetical protein
MYSGTERTWNSHGVRLTSHIATCVGGSGDPDFKHGPPSEVGGRAARVYKHVPPSEVVHQRSWWWRRLSSLRTTVTVTH